MGDGKSPLLFFFAWNFLENLALVETNEGYFVIDKGGKKITKLEVWDVRRMDDLIKDWNCFRCLFSRKQGLTGFLEGCLNWRGEVLFPPVHDRITDFFNGVAGFSDGEETLDSPWGLVNLAGEILKEPQYLQMQCFTEGVASAAQSLSSTGWIDEFGYIDATGEWVIPPKFQKAFPFSNGLARVGIGGVCNRFGEVIGEQRFGFINRKGELVIDAMFSSATDFVGNFAMGELDGKSIVFDREGKIIWEEGA